MFPRLDWENICVEINSITVSSCLEVEGVKIFYLPFRRWIWLVPNSKGKLSGSYHLVY